MGLLDNVTNQIGEEVISEQIANQAKSFLGGNSDNSSSNQSNNNNNNSDNKDNNSGDKNQSSNQSSSNSNSANTYVNKIESFIGEERVSQVRDKVGSSNFSKAESAIESQIESRLGGNNNK